jgi:hypothetical protein
MIGLSNRDIEFAAPLWVDKIVRSVIRAKNPLTTQNRAKRVIFIRIVKTRVDQYARRFWVSVAAIFRCVGISAYEPQLTEECFEFAGVRNLVDRFVSAFNGLKGSARYSDDYSKFVRRQIGPLLSAEDFGQWIASSPLNTRKFLVGCIFGPV